MTTDYQNLSWFEASAVALIAVGLAIIGFQIFVAVPEGARAAVTDALAVFDLHEEFEMQTRAGAFAVGGMLAFLDEFDRAFQSVVAKPAAEKLAYGVENARALARAFADYSDAVAANFQNNYQVESYAMPGVEAGQGGRVMGAFLERLPQ